MKRIQYHRYGGPEEMRLETFDPPPPGADEIVVRVKAASINPADWKMRQGRLKFLTGSRFPRAMGSDFSGVVESVGSSVTRFHAGDEVFGMTEVKPSGSFAEMLVTKEATALKKPESLSHEVAATLPAVGVTAWRALVIAGHLQPGQSVFINGAYGGVGQAATHLAKALGASVTGRVGPSAIADASAIGVDRVLDYTQDIPASLRHGFDVVLDCHGGLTPRQGDTLVKPSGVVVDISPTPQKMIRALLSRRRKIVFGNPSIEILEKIVELACAGKLGVTIGRTAPLEEAIVLITDLEAGRRAPGKSVILMA